MPKWGGKWGDKWGCDPADVALLEICEQYIWWQDQRHPNIKALCKIFAETMSEPYDQMINASRTRGIDQATGGALENIGLMLNQPRNGATDDLYRRVIKAKARAMLSEGRIGDLFDTVIQIAPNANPRFSPAFPACVLMVLETVSESERTVIVDIMRPDKTGRNFSSPLALGVCLSYIEVDPDGVFEFSYRELDNSLFPVSRHWGHSDGDIDPTQTAGMAYKVI